jgi:uncharacterized membrane protein YgcG
MRRFFLALLLLSNLAFAQSYRLERVEQDVFLQADGSARVLDMQAFRFDGDFRGSRYGLEVEPAPGGTVRFEGVEALDGRPVRWRVSGNEIEWEVDALNETRSFRLGYVLSREVEVAEDAAQFDRFVLDPEHEHIDHYLLRIHPPAPSPEGFRVFVFTGQGRIGTLDFADDMSVATVSLSPVGEGEFVRARVIVDAANFSVRTQEGRWLEPWLAEAREETRGFREESQRQLEDEGRVTSPPPSSLWLVLVWGAVAGLGLWLLLAYRDFGREPEIADVGPYYREPAEEIPPAAVPFVITQSDPGLQAASPAIAATLLDFARRGYLEIETQDSPGFLGLGRSQTVYYRLAREPKGLTPFEAELWKAFRGAAQGSTAGSLGGLFQLAGGRASGPNSDPAVFDAADLRRYFESRPSFGRGWIQAPRRWYEAGHGKLLDPSSGRRAAPIISLSFVMAALFGFAAFSLFALHPGFGLHLVLAAALCIFMGLTAGFSLKRWTPDKLLNARRWEAYRRFLADFSMMREAPAEHYQLWDYHFVYATALGVSKEYLRNLQELMKLEPDKFTAPLWLAGGRGVAMNQISSLGTLDSLSRSLNTLSQIETNLGNLNQALSPQAKTGGGFGGSSSGGGSRGGGFSGGPRGGGGGRGMR